jgi:hypothetical protein
MTIGYISIQAENGADRLHEDRAARPGRVHGPEGVELQEVRRQIEAAGVPVLIEITGH